MTNKTRGAVLLMALVLILTVAVSAVVLPGFAAALTIAGLLGVAFASWIPYLGNVPGKRRFSPRQFWASELGVVVTLYSGRSGIPGGGVLLNASNTPPTAIQASQLPRMDVLVAFAADTDTSATITHNWGLDASSPTYYDPEIVYRLLLTSGANTGTYLPALTFDVTNTNLIIVRKLAGANGNVLTASYLITLRRPVGPGM